MPSKEKLKTDVKQALSQNISERPLNITNILRNSKSLIKQVYQKGCIHKLNTKKGSK